MLSKLVWMFDCLRQQRERDLWQSLLDYLNVCETCECECECECVSVCECECV